MIDRGSAADIETLEKAIAAVEQEASAKNKGLTWQQAAERMEQRRIGAEEFTTYSEVAKTLGCSVETVFKAIQKIPVLKAWAHSTKKAK